MQYADYLGMYSRDAKKLMFQWGKKSKNDHQDDHTCMFCKNRIESSFFFTGGEFRDLMILI